MVARLKITPNQASQPAAAESDPQRVNRVNSPETLWPPRTSNPQPEVEHQRNLFQELPQVPVDTSRLSPFDTSHSPLAVPGVGLGHSRLSEKDEPMPLRPERTKRGFAETLKPIARKKNLRAVARFKRDVPMLICVDTINRAYRCSGLSMQDIADLIGVSRPTVAAALRVDESVNLYTFCEVLNVIGLELAEVAPMRRKQVVNEPRWQRGSFHSTANMARDIARVQENKRSRRRRNNWE